MQEPSIRNFSNVNQLERAALFELAKSDYAAFRATRTEFLFTYLTKIEVYAEGVFLRTADPYLQLHIDVLK